MVLLRKGLQSPVSPCNVTLDSVLLRGKYFHVAQHAPGSWLCYGGVSCLRLRVGQDLISHTAQLCRERMPPQPQLRLPGMLQPRYTSLHTAARQQHESRRRYHRRFGQGPRRGAKQVQNQSWLLSYFQRIISLSP